MDFEAMAPLDSPMESSLVAVLRKRKQFVKRIDG
jgi:hypothetical protein